MKTLILPNDARWINPNGFFPVFEPVKGYYTLIIPQMPMVLIRDAAAVAACWWYHQWIKFGRDEMTYQFIAWLSLSNATSLDGYEFTPWKETN